jgi:hypothetical protein
LRSNAVERIQELHAELFALLVGRDGDVFNMALNAKLE